jgi:hypothetical protein
MAPQTPYTADLGDRDPIAALRETPAHIRAITSHWTPAQFERSYAPGKWSARLIVVHLAQTELGLGARARMALTIPDYIAQPFDQDRWLPLDSRISGAEAVDVFVAIATFNRAAFAALAPNERAAKLSHPEYGSLTVDWIIHQMAGHQIHHCTQLERIDRS